MHGLVDNIIMRVVDIMLALPSLLLALVLVAIFGPSIGNAALALTFASKGKRRSLFECLVIL